MPDQGLELQRIAWTRTFPFLRLFRTFKLATHFNRLALGLGCVFGCYLVGRTLDSLWPDRGRVLVSVERGRSQNEIEVYARAGHDEFELWRQRARDSNLQADVQAVRQLAGINNPEVARQKVVSDGAVALLDDETFRKERAAIAELIETRVKAGVARIAADTNATADEKQQRRTALHRAADYLRLVVAGQDVSGFGTILERTAAVDVLVQSDPALDDVARAAEQARLKQVEARQAAVVQARDRAGGGPFIALLDFEMCCFAAAIQGVCAGNWGTHGTALDEEPALLGSIRSAFRGVLWLIAERPWFALLYGIAHLVLFAFFGGAICRSSAVQAAREENIPLSDAVRFACEKFGALVLAAALPAGFFFAGGVAIIVGGFLGAIPILGELVSAAFFVLAILGGFVLALILIGAVTGFHLLWPTIAVEGSDAFDAATHAYSYVFQRPWHTAFYSLALLVYGGAAFVMVRLTAAVTLKLTHTFAATGIGLFGAVSSARTDTVGKLDAIWQMPAWSDLPLLPAAGGVPFWGTFASVPLNWSETLAMWLIALWVFLVVGLVGGFVVSYFFCGSTQMYYVLRKQVDAMDFEEVYYEEREDLLAGASAPPAADVATGGTPLPVVGTPPSA